MNQIYVNENEESIASLTDFYGGDDFKYLRIFVSMVNGTQESFWQRQSPNPTEQNYVDVANGFFKLIYKQRTN